MTRPYWAFPLVLLVLTSCVGLPTQQDIENDLNAQLGSVVGPWNGSGPGKDTLTLRFSLAAQGDSLGGSGWAWAGGGTDSTTVAVHGRFERPTLNLSFESLVWQGEVGSGRFRGDYVTVGGVLDTLWVTTPGQVTPIPMLLQER